MRALQILDRVFRPLALLAALTGLGVALYTERSGISHYPWRLSWLTFVAAVCLFACGPLTGAAVFHILLRRLTGRTRFADTTQVWMRAFLARYVPSGALTMAVRLRARCRLRARARDVWVASLLEQLVAAIGGSAAATLALLLSGGHLTLAAPAILAVALVLGAALPVRRVVARASLVSLAGWILPGSAAWLVVTALTPTQMNPVEVAGAYAFAWTLGFVFVLAPSGLGVREATFIALIGSQVGVAPATLVAVALRLASTLGDLLAFTAVEAAFAARRRAARSHRGRPIPGRLTDSKGVSPC
jgi:uncharacterized membrane protein YbhN (UPF0104 family)